MTWDYLLTSIIVVASPGTGALITIAAGLSHGRRASLIAALGCTLGIVPHMLAAVSGLAAILHASAVAFDALKYAGVTYLLYMAWMTWKESGTLVAQESTARSDVDTIRFAIVANLLNPKLSIFFLAFLPQFVKAADPHPVTRMLELSLLFMALTFFIFAGCGLFAAAMRKNVLSRPRTLFWMRNAFAAAFVGLAARLAATSR